MILTLLSALPEETRWLGEALGRMSVAGDVYCINGDLGSGKTVFAKGVAVGIEVKTRVTSPTFTLINEYQGRIPFFHMDVYRLAGPEEMIDLGYEEYFYGQGVTLVEWAEQVYDILPVERLDIFIMRTDDEKNREIRFTSLGEKYHRLVERLKTYVCAGS